MSYPGYKNIKEGKKMTTKKIEYEKITPQISVDKINLQFDLLMDAVDYKDESQVVVDNDQFSIIKAAIPLDISFDLNRN